MLFVEHPWINPQTIEQRDYQTAIVDTAVRGNTLVVIPTGLGKTSIGVLVAAERLSKNWNAHILVMAPTKPLVNQHMKVFEKSIKDGLTMNVITGQTNPEDREVLYKKTQVVFSTPQTIANDLKKGTISLADFSLCIIDEAHRCVGNYAYVYVAKTYMQQARDSLILALTASPGSTKEYINNVKEKLFIDYVEIRDRENEDVLPYVKRVDKHWISDELPPPLQYVRDCLLHIKNDRLNRLATWNLIHSSHVSKTQLLKLQAELSRKQTGVKFAALSVIAEILKIDHALALLETQTVYSLKTYIDSLSKQTTKAVERLRSDENFIHAVRLIDELYREGAEHPKLIKLREVVAAELENNKHARIIIFAQFRDTITRICEYLQPVKNAAPVAFVGQAKKRGTGLKQKEQMQILNEFDMGFYNILVATQIGEEGLHIAETGVVIFYEPVPSAIRLVQRMGRTARTQPGTVIILITKNTRDESYHWSSQRKERQMKSVVTSIQERQKSLLSYKKRNQE